jgi:hypothetical protein
MKIHSKVRSIILFVVFFCITPSFAQSIAYEILIEEENAVISCGEFISDCNYDMVGPLTYVFYKNDTVHSRYSRILKINENGDTNSYFLSKQDTLFSISNILEIKDEGYLLWGFYYDDYVTNQVEVFIRTDYNLNVTWERHYDFNHYYAASGRKILHTSKDELLFACNPDWAWDMYLLKLSLSGDLLAYRYFEGDSAGQVQSLTHNFDSSGYFLHTWESYDPPGVIRNTMIEIDNDLNHVNHWYYPSWYNKPFESTIWPGRRFITAGEEMVVSGGANHYFTAYILDDKLEVIKKKQLTHPDTSCHSAYYRNMDVVDTSFIYFGGSFNGHYHSSLDTSWYYIAMLDHNLELVYEKYIGGDMHYWCECITATSDGGVLMTGSIFDVNVTPVRHKAYIVKLDTTNLPVNIQQPTYLQFYDALVYPNPGSDVLNIRTTLKNAWIELYDINGRPIFRQELNKHITQINTNHLPGGTYIYTIVSNEQQVQSGKWIKN